MSKKKKKKSPISIILTIFLVLAIEFIVALLATNYLDTQQLSINPDGLMNQYFLMIYGVLVLISIALWLTRLMKKDEKKTEAKVEDIGDVSKFYDTHWQTESELVKNPAYKYTLYSNLQNTKNIGIPIRAEYKGGKLHVNMYQPIHTLVIGTTGMGKTTQYVDPMIQILSESAKRPCFVVSDPKGEIWQNHARKLEKRGYRVLVFDLIDPFKSTCWNPMTRAYELNQEALNLPKKVRIHRGEDPRQTNLILASKLYYNEWYELDGYAFGPKEEVQKYIAGRQQALRTEAHADLNDIATTLAPIESQQDPIWDRGAKDFILSGMMAMLEDSENPALGMTKEKFNFYNLAKIMNFKDTDDPYDNMKSLKEYYQGRNPLSQAVQLSNQITTNNEKTASSYLGIVSDRMNLFSDMGICYATSVNEMNLNTFCDQPTALFIKNPDEKITRHKITTMFISQLYKVLVEIARKNNGALPIDTYFLLDEFGNLPKIENFDTMITVARSRKIWFILILQSYAQLNIKYGDQVSRTVEDNCNIHIYIASNDPETQKKFSDRCGKITVETKSTSINKGKEESSKSTGVSIQKEQRPLIYPEELGTLKDDMIVSIIKQPPIKAVFTPSYKIRNWDDPKYGKQSVAPIYDMVPCDPPATLPKTFNEQEMYYDIKKRNQIVLGNRRNSNNNW